MAPPTETETTTTATTTTPIEPPSSILHLVSGIDTTTTPSNATDNSPDDLAGYDAEQIRLMDEVCIVLDADDNPIGSASKKICHQMENINKGLLHRAFSVFLFDSKDRLLLQQRASEKITFPDMWTNTCCSHPLAHPAEMGNTLPTSITGVKRAAQRKLEHELGISPSQVPLDAFTFLTRIHYLAPSDAKWGEHEIDYILFIKADVDYEINANEVKEAKYVTLEELRSFMQEERGKAEEGLKFTPWFGLICDTLLFGWWDVLRKEGMQGITKVGGETEIRRL